MSEEEIDKSILTKYEVQTKLGKGVSVLMGPTLSQTALEQLAHASHDEEATCGLLTAGVWCSVEGN